MDRSEMMVDEREGRREREVFLTTIMSVNGTLIMVESFWGFYQLIADY